MDKTSATLIQAGAIFMQGDYGMPQNRDENEGLGKRFVRNRGGLRVSRIRKVPILGMDDTRVIII
jgi:hypothetical protein